MHARRRRSPITSTAPARGDGGVADRNRWVALGIACIAGLLVLTGCAKMDAALDQQWMVVDFNPNTSVATALHVRAACSHIENTPPMALPSQRNADSIMYGIRYDTTNSSPANLAQLQTCLQRFPSVQGVDPEDAGDEGD